MLGQQSGVLDPSTIADGKMTRINYAFFGLKDGVIVERRETDGANLAALTGLRKENPWLQILVSVGGGGNGSAGFSDMASTAEGRKRFVRNNRFPLPHAAMLSIHARRPCKKIRRK